MRLELERRLRIRTKKIFKEFFDMDEDLIDEEFGGRVAHKKKKVRVVKERVVNPEDQDLRPTKPDQGLLSLMDRFEKEKKKKEGLKQSKALLAENMTIPQVEMPAPIERKEEDPIRQVEDILLVLETFSPNEVREKSGQKWFDARLNRRHEAVVRIKKDEGKLSRLVDSESNFSMKDRQELLDGIYYMSQPELRERHQEDWQGLKDFLEKKAGLDTGEAIAAFEKLYTEAKSVETTLMRMTGPGEIDKKQEIKDQLLLVKEYLSTGRFPKGWGWAKKTLEEQGVGITSYERMREMEKRKKYLDLKIFGRRDVLNPEKDVTKKENSSTQEVVPMAEAWEKDYEGAKYFHELKLAVGRKEWPAKAKELREMDEEERREYLLYARALVKVKASGDTSPEALRLLESKGKILVELGLMI